MALTFLREFMLRRHRSAPPPPPDILFVALKGGRVVGSTSLDFDERGHLPFEKIWKTETSPVLALSLRGKVVQFGRWAAQVPRVSVAIGYVAVAYALKCGKTHGWCEAKPSAASRMRSIGVDLREVSSGGIDLEKVSSEGRPYYETLPYPKLYIIDLTQAERALRERAIPLFERKEVFLKPGLL